ncbi:MAG TPA: universal stress protein [Vicinamibacterales bacterium]|nr:universal stress protein [Vicinamibacterales bacterium]
MIALNSILVATDFSEPAGTALRYGLELAKRFDARLHVLHVVDDLAAHPYTVLPGPPDVVALQKDLEAESRASLEALLPEPARSASRALVDMVVSTSPAEAIMDFARDHQVDLIIIGTHGRRGLARVILGSVARHVSGAAPCPVLTVRAHERDFVRPEAEAVDRVPSCDC